MFTTKEAIQEWTGIIIDQATLGTAQMMIEAYIGKSENDVIEVTDRDTLGRAVTFQAIYINGQHLDILEQVALKGQTVGASNTQFNTDMLAPFMSPWAVLTCSKLSWLGTRTVHTGAMFAGPNVPYRWERD